MEDKSLATYKDLDNVSLQNQSLTVVDDLIKAQDIDTVKDLTHLFNVNIAKKNAVRILKLEQLFDKVSDSMIDRFENRPGEFSNDDLISYMNTVQNAIEKSKKNLDKIDEAPPISIQQNNQVNISLTDSLTREERENVKDAVDSILNMLKQNTEEDIITIDENLEELNTDESD